MGQGPVKKGKVRHNYFGAFYRFEGDRIASVRVYNATQDIQLGPFIRGAAWLARRIKKLVVLSKSF